MKRMTKDHLERAARLVCKERGLDPDEREDWNPKWIKVAEEIESVYQCVVAIGETVTK